MTAPRVTPAWRAIEAVVIRDHIELCFDMACVCEEAIEAMTTELYDAVVEENR